MQNPGPILDNGGKSRVLSSEGSGNDNDKRYEKKQGMNSSTTLETRNCDCTFKKHYKLLLQEQRIIQHKITWLTSSYQIYFLIIFLTKMSIAVPILARILPTGAIHKRIRRSHNPTLHILLE